MSATVIYLAGRLPGRSSSLPGSRNGPDQPCSLIWPCSRWGLPSQPVTRLLVGSYPTFSPLPRQGSGMSGERMNSKSLSSLTAYRSSLPRRYTFCCTFPVLRRRSPADSDGGRYPPPCPVEPGLSSPRSTPGLSPRTLCEQRPSVQPADIAFSIARTPHTNWFELVLFRGTAFPVRVGRFFVLLVESLHDFLGEVDAGCHVHRKR